MRTCGAVSKTESHDPEDGGNERTTESSDGIGRYARALASSDEGASISTKCDEEPPLQQSDQASISRGDRISVDHECPRSDEDDAITMDSSSRTLTRQIPRGILNVSGVSCHVSAALQLIYHGLPEVRDVLLKLSELSKSTSASPRMATKCHEESEKDKEVGVGGSEDGSIDTEWTAMTFLVELTRLFLELSSKELFECNADKESLGVHTDAVDPTILYGSLPPSLDCHNLGDAATALRVVLATLRGAVIENICDKDGSTASEEAMVLEELRHALARSLDGSSVQSITGEKIFNESDEEEDKDNGNDQSSTEGVDSEGDVINGHKNSGDELLSNARFENMKIQAKTTSDKKISEDLAASTISDEQDQNQDKEQELHKSSDSCSGSKCHYQVPLRKRITRTKPGRERSWTCPFPVPVRGYRTLQGAINGATTETQPIIGYDWDNIKDFDEKVECLGPARGENISVSSSGNSSDSDSGDSSADNSSDSDSSGSEGCSDSSSSGDDSSSDSDSSSSSSTYSSDDEIGRFCRRRARTKCSRCARLILPFFPWLNKESSSSSSSSEMSFFTVESFTNTTDSSMTSSSSSSAQPSSFSSQHVALSKDELNTWKTEKMSQFSLLPQHLIVHLKRFDYAGGKVQKIDSELDVPLEIDLSPFLTEGARCKLKAEGQEEFNNESKLITSGSVKKYEDIRWSDASAFLDNDGEINCKAGKESAALLYGLRGAIVYDDTPSDPNCCEDEDAGHYLVFVRIDQTNKETTDQPCWVCIDDEHASVLQENSSMKARGNVSGACRDTHVLDMLSGRRTERSNGQRYATVLLFSQKYT